MAIAIGARLENSGPLSLDPGVPELARTLEAAGFDSIWVSDHIVLPAEIGSRYPFTADGRAPWPPETPYLDALVSLALAASVTERVRLGTAVLVLPLRNPVEVAKQAASIDVASGGRLELGVGAGWLEEEFAALGVPFRGRGSRLEEWMGIVRDCWTGHPAGSSSARYTLPEGTVCLPLPAHPVPLLVGGHSQAAWQRAGLTGDGWLAHQSLSEIDISWITAGELTMRDTAWAAGRDADELRVVLRVAGTKGRASDLARRLRELEAIGVHEVIVDVDFDGDPAADCAALREGAGE